VGLNLTVLFRRNALWAAERLGATLRHVTSARAVTTQKRQRKAPKPRDTTTPGSTPLGAKLCPSYYPTHSKVTTPPAAIGYSVLGSSANSNTNRRHAQKRANKKHRLSNEASGAQRSHPRYGLLLSRHKLNNEY
jgi:hypothetical protein